MSDRPRLASGQVVPQLMVSSSPECCVNALLGDWPYSDALLDFSGAFETIIRETALSRMAEAGIDTSTITILICNTTQCLGRPFSTNIGVVQGDPLSHLMYIMYAEGTMRKIDGHCPLNSALPCPFSQYTDDTTVQAANSTTLPTIVNSCEPFSLKITSV